MLAYVFWHWKRADVAAAEYEARQREFHRALGGAPPVRFVRSYSHALTGAPWAANGGDGPVIGFVGRLTPQKGVETLIAAFHALEHEHAQLLIVGDGESRAALEAAAKAGRNAARITFLGSRKDTPELFRAMNLFVLPSYVEAFPMVLLEAMATGVPVVGTPVGDVPKIISPEVGWIVPPGDEKALTARLADSLAEPGRLANMGGAARTNVVARHSALAFARNYTRLYERISTGRKQS